MNRIRVDNKSILIDKMIVKESKKIHLKDSKVNTRIEIKENVNLSIASIIEEKEVDLNIVFIVKENASLNIDIFIKNETSKINFEINLVGKNAKSFVNIAVISQKEVQEVINVKHLSQNTTSDVKLRGIAIDKPINFKVTSSIPKEMINSITNQDLKIINISDQVSIIKPILLIDEMESTAHHATAIGRFDDNEIFYLQSRGIDLEKSKRILMKGFIISILNDQDIIKTINMNWR